MRNLVSLFVVVIVIAVAAFAVAPSAEADMTGSTVSGVSAATVNEGATFDFTFDVYYTSPDVEFFSHFSATLPAEWTINSVGAAPAWDSFCTVETLLNGNSGQTVYWEEDGWPDGCGPWSNDGGTYTFTVNVTVTSCANAPWDIPWTIGGDGWGSAPHTVTGTYSSVACNAAYVMNVPHISDILIYSWAQVVAYDSPGGSPATLANGAPVVLPADYDGNGYDTYVVTDSAVVGGETWVSIFLGSENFVWVPLSQVELAGPQP